MAVKFFCVIVPAYNEGKVIASSLFSLKKIFNKDNIYVVSDGSTDNTASIARAEKVNVLDLKKNHGKALAQEKVICRYKLTERYKYVLFSDADSQIDKNFLKEARKFISKKPALIVGTVRSEKKGLISAFRTYEYGLSHRIFKSAQNVIKTVTVAPGCASLYNSKVLEKLNLKSPTITEDFDLTIQIHKSKLGEIVYANRAIVITQDPLTLKDYWKQVLRWNIGTWQNYFLHKLFRLNNKYNLELNFLFLDNFLWAASIILAAFYISALANIFLGMLATLIACAIAISVAERRYWIIPYIPIFPLFYVINITSFFYALFLVIFCAKKQRNFLWNKLERYASRDDTIIRKKRPQKGR